MKVPFLLYPFFKTHKVCWCPQGSDANATDLSGIRIEQGRRWPI